MKNNVVVKRFPNRLLHGWDCQTLPLSGSVSQQKKMKDPINGHSFGPAVSSAVAKPQISVIVPNHVAVNDSLGAFRLLVPLWIGPG